ncbi:peptide/nickel transport system permease protein [Rhodoligotrophos appendicifer]|uniref:ABC transporter permease n=1 Tax=Rhodoligotrophos appendicifer TaxID=987056 RepID=UPI001180DAC8|nr:ABC transporter permease [Rhodoligotrophos appendicifer]
MPSDNLAENLTVPPERLAVASVSPARPRPRQAQLLHRLIRDPVGAFALGIVATILLIAIFAPLIAPHDPLKINVLHKLASPSWSHWLGTDSLGRDTLSRVIYGTRVAVSVAMISMVIAASIGLVLGMLAGYGPRWLDAIFVLVFDSVSSLPMIMLALAMITVLGPSTFTLVLVIVTVSIPAYARLIRAQTLSMKRAEHILAERSLGAGTPRIIFVHVLPNVVGPLLILVSMDIPVVIMLEAGLSFLGIGIRPPQASWGTILNEGYSNIRDTPMLIIAGGVPLVLATLGFTFLGETLRDALDPRLKRSDGL